MQWSKYLHCAYTKHIVQRKHKQLAIQSGSASTPAYSSGVIPVADPYMISQYLSTQTVLNQVQHGISRNNNYVISPGIWWRWTLKRGGNNSSTADKAQPTCSYILGYLSGKTFHWNFIMYTSHMHVHLYVMRKGSLKNQWLTMESH